MKRLSFAKTIVFSKALGLCLLLLSRQLYAQDVTTSENVFIQDGLSINIDGSVTNSGFILNNGNITLSGDWLNTLTYQGLGAVFLTGTNQQINNNNQSIYALTIDGGGIKTINGKIIIDHIVTFTDGIVTVADNDTLMLAPDVKVLGSSSFSYVDGAVISVGSGTKLFPIGKNGKYHPVELLNVTGIDPVIEAEVHENFPPVTSSLPATPFADIYWTQKIISGSYDGSPVTLHYNVPNDLDAERLVMLEGVSLSDPFTARETTLTRHNDLDAVESRNALTGNILALATLTVEPPREHYFSTTLSPNAANPENRVIKVFGDQVTSTDFRFQVFNRWGLVMFETSSANKMMTDGWDGRHNGSLLPSGVYPYSLSYVSNSGKPVKRTGFITIIQ